MHRLIFGHDAELVSWVRDRIPHVSVEGSFGPSVAIGVSDGASLLGAVIYHNYAPMYRSVEISMAADSPRWATRGIIAALLHYPFVQLGCQRITTAIPKRHKRARRFNEGLGFKLEGTIRKGFGNDDACLYGLLRDEASKWLGSAAA